MICLSIALLSSGLLVNIFTGDGDAPESHDDRDDSEDDEGEEVHENRPSSSDSKNKNDGQKKREKFDSGLGDEIVETHSASSDDENDMKLGRLGLNSGLGTSEYAY